MKKNEDERTPKTGLLERLFHALPFTVGTKSVLFGAHQFLIHPFYTAWGWKLLYGWPCDPRLWVAFFVHDLGYWGKPNMDGAEGEGHPWLGAVIMGKLFGKEWFEFCLYHSRFYAAAARKPYSRLCVADKLVPFLQPAWMYIPMASWSGEIYEYMRDAANKDDGKYRLAYIDITNKRTWYKSVGTYMAEWAVKHKDGEPDEMTPDTWVRGG